MRPLLAFAVATFVAITVNTVAPRLVLAGPPPSPPTCPSFGPCLVLATTHGKAAAAIKAEYWFVPDGSCPYKEVQFSWDGMPITTLPIDATDCYALYTFPKAPSSEVRPHRVTAQACPSPTGGGCDPNASITVDYTVDPTPSLTLSLTKGLAATAFTATYKTGESQCSSAAQFYWGTTPLGAPVPLDATCTAVMDFKSVPSPNGAGKHTLKAEICARTGCSLTATAAFTVTVPATPTPTATAKPTAKPTATPAPTATPVASVIPSESPAASPSTEPSAGPSASPSPSTEPSASPSEAVLSATSAPQPTSSTAPGVAVPAGSGTGTPPRTNPYVPELAAFVGGPETGAIDSAVVATNLFLTLLILLFFGVTAEIFNSTMDANRDEVHGWWTRLVGGPLRFMTPLVVTGASLDRLSGSGRVGSILRVLTVLALLGLIYGFLSPDFGLNPQSLILFLSLVIGLGFMTYFSEGSSSRIAKRRYRANASIKLYGTAVIVAVLAVVISRSVSFQPGLVYGFIATAVIVAPIALAKRDDATLVLIPAFGLLLVSVLAWLLLGPVKVLAADGSPGPAFLQTILAMIVIGGLEGLFVTMIPLRFMDGAAVLGWSKVAWALTFGTVTFLWWQLLLNQNASYAKAFEQTNVQVVLTVLVIFMITTGGLWSYFRFRPSRTEVEA